jgi:hypothetical protein
MTFTLRGSALCALLAAIALSPFASAFSSPDANQPPRAHIVNGAWALAEAAPDVAAERSHRSPRGDRLAVANQPSVLTVTVETRVGPNTSILTRIPALLSQR